MEYIYMYILNEFHECHAERRGEGIKTLNPRGHTHKFFSFGGDELLFKGEIMSYGHLFHSHVLGMDA